jgi:GT2 family glycosyltransferase
LKTETAQGEDTHQEGVPVDWIIGACMLVKRQVWQEVGGFDERFFMYAEETDWQLRMRKAGWLVHFLPTAQVTHLAGASGKSDETRISRHFFESLDIYYWKNYGWQGLLSLRAAMTIGCAARTILWGLASALPPRRSRARAQSRKMAKLLLRQAFNWKMSHINKP